MKSDGPPVIYRFGELAVCDTAFRLGVWLKLWPKAVYLHAGARVGAKAQGLDVRRDCLDMAELPGEVRVLKPWQVEDFLCIFKRKLAMVPGSNIAASRPVVPLLTEPLMLR